MCACVCDGARVVGGDVCAIEKIKKSHENIVPRHL